MNPELSRRVGRIMIGPPISDLPLGDRQAFRKTVEQADSFDDLDPKCQQVIIEGEEWFEDIISNKGPKNSKVPPSPLKALPPFFKQDWLKLTAEQAARLARNEAIRLGRPASEVQQVGNVVFEHVHVHTTNRGAIYQRELLRHLNAGKTEEEARRLADFAARGIKDLSYLSQTRGGALVPPAKQRSRLGSRVTRKPKLKSIFSYLRKGEGEPCKPGETAERSGCIPASGETHAPTGKPESAQDPAERQQDATPSSPEQVAEKATEQEAKEVRESIGQMTARQAGIGMSHAKKAMRSAADKLKEYKGQAREIAADPEKRKAFLRHLVAGLVASARFLALSMPVFNTARYAVGAVKTLGEMKIVGKGVRAWAGKEEWNNDDTKELIRAVYDIPAFVVTTVVDFGIPGTGIIFPHLMQTEIGKKIFPRAMTTDKDDVVSKFIDKMEAYAKIPEEMVAGKKDLEDIDLTESQIEFLLALVEMLEKDTEDMQEERPQRFRDPPPAPQVKSLGLRRFANISGFTFDHRHEAKSLQGYYSKAIGGGQTPGVPFQGPSGRWFVIRPSDNRVVPTKAPGSTTPAPKQPKAKKPAAPKPAAKKPAATKPAKPVKPAKPAKPAKVVPPKPTAAQLQQEANQHLDELAKKVANNEKLSAKELKAAAAHVMNLPLSDLQAQASKLGLSSSGTKVQLEVSIAQSLRAYKPLTAKQIKVKKAKDFLENVKGVLNNKQPLSAQDLLDLPKHLKELAPTEIEDFIKSLSGPPDLAKGKATNIKRLVEFAKVGGVPAPKVKKAKTVKPKGTKAAVAATKNKKLSYHDKDQRDDIDDLVEIALEELKEAGRRVDYNDLGSLMALKADVWKRISPAFEAGSSMNSILDRSLRGLQSQRATIMLPPSFGGTPRGPNANAPESMRPDLTGSEKAALQSYTGTTYRTLNKFQREQGKPPGKLKHIQEGLDNAFHKATIFDKPVKVTRSVTLDPTNTAAYIAALQASQNAGTPHDFGQILSTSTNPNPPGGGSHNIEVRVNAIHGLDVKPYSHCPQANEVILHHHSRYKVNSVKQDPVSGRWVAELDQIAPHWAGEAGEDPPAVIKPAGQVDNHDLRKIPAHPGALSDAYMVRGGYQSWTDFANDNNITDLEKIHYHLGLKKPDDYATIGVEEKKKELARSIAKHLQWKTPVAYRPAGQVTSTDVDKVHNHLSLRNYQVHTLKRIIAGNYNPGDIANDFYDVNQVEQIAHHFGVEEPAGYARTASVNRIKALGKAIEDHLVSKPGPGFFQRMFGGSTAAPPPSPPGPPTPTPPSTPAKPRKAAAPRPNFPPSRPVQPAKTFSSPHDSQTVQDILAGKQLHTYHRNTAGGGREDTALNEILHESGRSNPPAVHDAAGIDNLAKQGWTVSYRSVKDENQTHQFREGDLYNGSGIYGNGTYVAAAKGSHTEDHARLHSKTYGSHTMRIAIPPTAKIVKSSALRQQQGKYLTKLEKDFKAKKISAIDYMRHKALVRDEGRFAALHNYDVIDSEGPNAYMVIINRSICAVQKDNV